MTKLLHIESSPRKQRSTSFEVAEEFIAQFKDRRPETRVTTLDLWSNTLPEFGEDALNAKYAGLSGTPLTLAQQDAWRTLRELSDHLHEADVLLLSVPMWNFGIPYKLKHFIDLVSQKGLLFSFDPESGLMDGLLRNKKAVVVYTRGLDYARESNTPAENFDFQKPYVEAWLKFIGVTEISSIIVEKTALGSDAYSASRQQADVEIRELASRLGTQAGAQLFPLVYPDRPDNNRT